jgi:hypothetical protein
MADPALEKLKMDADMLPLNAEYDRVEAIFTKDLKRPDACICAIYKVRDAGFTAGLEACAAEIATKRGKAPDRIHVYHGTTIAAAASICRTGFDPSYSSVAVYGKGTYASPNPSTALGYCKDTKTKMDFSMVFLCKFLKGTFGTHSSGGILDTTKIDYSGTGYDILVTPYRYGIIPEYLICYYAWS